MSAPDFDASDYERPSRLKGRVQLDYATIDLQLHRDGEAPEAERFRASAVVTVRPAPGGIGSGLSTLERVKAPTLREAWAALNAVVALRLEAFR